MTDYMQDKFFQVPRESRKTSEGGVEFPILYFDSSCITAFFLCDLDKVKNQLLGLALKPSLVIGNKALIGIAFYEYRKTSIGSYNEVGVAIPVIRESDKRPLFSLLDLYANPETRKSGFYVIDLPVSTSAANAAGREIWGFPKFVTEISFELDKHNFSGSVLDPDGKEGIVNLEGRMGMGILSPAMHLKLYSYLDGEELATVVNLKRGSTLRSGGSMKLTVGKSEHLMAERLRALGLDGASPLALVSTDKFQSRLNLGVPVKNH